MREPRISQDIVAVSDLRAQAAEWLKRVATTGAPLIVTQHGRAAGVLLSPEAFDQLTESARLVSAVSEGLADVQAGRSLTHAQFARTLKARYRGSGR